MLALSTFKVLKLSGAGCSKLTTSLVNVSFLNTNFTNTMLFFVGLQKILTFFQQKIMVYVVVIILNEFTS